MGLLTVKSTNPALSYVVAKNPDTILQSGTPFHRPLRKGTLYGWFEDSNQTFVLWFRDHAAQTSFGGDFEYLDRTRYSSPQLYLAMIDEGLRTASRGVEQDADEYHATVTAVVEVTRKTLLRPFLQDPGTTAEEIGPCQYQISVCKPTVMAALNSFMLICLMQALVNPSCRMDLGQSAVGKYVSMLARCNAPYYIRYTLATKALTDRGMFSKFANAVSTPTMKLHYGNTQQQRFDAISAAMQRRVYGGGMLSATFRDVGCGELFYTLRLAKNYEEVYSYEAEESLALRGKALVNRRDLPNVSVYHETVTPEFVEEHANDFYGADVLVTEVLEHMPKADSDALLQSLLSARAFRVFATVPNKDFNVHYGLEDGETRHPEHCFEPTFAEWADYCVEVAARHNYKVDILPIGDVVDDASVSTLAVFYQEEKEAA